MGRRKKVWIRSSYVQVVAALVRRTGRHTRAQLCIVLTLASGIRQAHFGERELIEQLLPGLGLRGGTNLSHLGDGTIRRESDGLGIALKLGESEEAIVAQRPLR